MQAVLQMSAGVPYSAPIRTSRALYCLVWMSSVKCLCWTRDMEEERRRTGNHDGEEEEETMMMMMMVMKDTHHPACIS